MKVGDLVRFFNPVDVVVWENQNGLVLPTKKIKIIALKNWLYI